MRILISGAGIAGLTFALRAVRDGHHAVVVEKAGALRDQGYMIDFFGSGYDAAERLGLLAELAGIHYEVPRFAFLSHDGREKFSIAYSQLRKLFDDRHFNFMRGDLERVLYDRLGEQVEIRFGTTVQELHDRRDGIDVGLSDGTSGSFDLLVGADGLHSGVRLLAFGEEERFKRFLGYYTAAFIVDQGSIPEVRPDAFYTVSTPGRQAGVYPIRGGKLAAFFIHRSPRLLGSPTHARACVVLHEQYKELGWVIPALLRCCDARDEAPYFDEVAQIEMPSWVNGRVVLVGDACQCLSLLAGQGASMAMAGAYILAEELSKEGSLPRALARYERRMRWSIEKKQRAGRKMAAWFAPESRLRIAIRDSMMRMSAWPVASGLIKRQLAAESVLDPTAGG